MVLVDFTWPSYELLEYCFLARSYEPIQHNSLPFCNDIVHTLVLTAAPTTKTMKAFESNWHQQPPQNPLVTLPCRVFLLAVEADVRVLHFPLLVVDGRGSSGVIVAAT